MGASQYASSFGRLQSIAINFLSDDALQNLLKANSVTDIVKQLESTWYGEEIKKSASVYNGAELLDCLLYTSPSPRDPKTSRMPSSA